MGTLFGTDGIRGRAEEGWLSASAARLIGRTLGEVLNDGAIAANPSSRVRRALLGHDGRHSGPILEAAMAVGLGEAGYDCTSAGLITTPGLALVGRLEDYDVTVMISASHNPAEDNGIKAFGRGGSKLTDEVENELEARLIEYGCPTAEDADRVASLPAAPAIEERYAQYLVESIEGLSLTGMSIVIDCSNGGGSRVGPKVLGRLGAQVHAIAAEPDGANINAGCGATDLALLQSEVRRIGADLGLALDGDGDRCILVDENGEVVHGDGIMTVIANEAMSRGLWTDARIVATVMSNKGLHRALRSAGVGVLTVGVGDRNVVASLKAERLSLGGEQSGHVIFGDDLFHIGDGLYTGLRVLDVMQRTGQSLTQLAAPYSPFPQVLLNIRVSRKPPLEQLDGLAAAVDAVEDELGEDGRVLLRYSGTESLARVMVEGPDSARIEAMAGDLAAIIADQIGEA